MKHTKKIAAGLLFTLLLPFAAPAAAFAAEPNTPKEEVVYINLNSDGSVKEINVVNIFDLAVCGRITDYGTYETLRNMTTTDKINYSGDTVTLEAGAGRLYYEGKLKSSVMPWNISIRYFMDGTEYSAEEIAGRSGDLKIKLNITQNPECAGDFFNGYALQASLTLDTKKCSNINAEEATLANVGSKKQLTYTILPGEGADLEITASVRDFELDAITINGVKLNLSIEVDDTEIQGKLTELIDAVTDLDKGAGELRDGAEALSEATKTLQEKTDELQTGAGELAGGASALAGGLSSLTAKNEELLAGAQASYQGLCTAAETVLNAELAKNGYPTVTLTPENYAAVLENLLKLMDTDAAATVTNLKAQLDSYGLFCQGLADYTAAAGALAAGADTLNTGLAKLHESTGLFSLSAGELDTAVGTLFDGTEELKNGTAEFAEKTSGMDTEVSGEIDSMISSATGGDIKTTSFVSEKNKDVESVQFVLKTNPIQKEKITEPVVEKTKPLNFWQKLLRLFGLY